MPTSTILSVNQGSVLVGDELKACFSGEQTAGGVRHGQGVYNFPNRFFRYEGKYVDGQKHGARSLAHCCKPLSFDVVHQMCTMTARKRC
jgi:MORN repeat